MSGVVNACYHVPREATDGDLLAKVGFLWEYNYSQWIS